MNFVALAALAFAVVGGMAHASTTCRDITPVTIQSQNFTDQSMWVLYGSLSPYDKNLSFTTQVLDDPTHALVEKINGTDEKEIELIFQKYEGFIDYYDKTNKVPVIVRILFFNGGQYPNFCFYKCFDENPDAFQFMRCYGTDQSSSAAIKSSFDAKDLALNGGKLYQPLG